MINLITIIIHNSGLELINSENTTISHNAIKNDVLRRKKKKAREILLDISVHQAAIKPNIMAYSGRPDIIHQSLLAFHHNMKLVEEKVQQYIRLIIHTKNNLSFEVPSFWRIPVSYIRFRGLIEQLLLREVLHLTENEEIKIHNNSLKELIDQIDPTSVYNLTMNGKTFSDTPFFNQILNGILTKEDIILLIGGYQKGGDIFTELKTPEVFNIQLFTKPTTAWNILSYILHYIMLKNNKLI